MLNYRFDTFLEVCRTMNYTQAAKNLHITQPAVSQHIHSLEKEYGVTLFLYEKKKLQLTSAGEILRKRLTAMLNDERSLIKELQSQGDVIETLSLGVTMTIGEYAIVPAIASYLKKHPKVNMRIHYGNTKELLKLLDAGELQMAFVEGNYPKDGYGHRRFSTEAYIGVCAKDHVFHVCPPKSLGDLTKERLLLREEGSGTRRIFIEHLSARGLQIKDFPYITQVENMHTIIELVKEDCGITFLYKTAVESELLHGTLQELELLDFQMYHDFDFIWEKDSIYQKKYMDFFQEIRQLAKPDPSI